MEKVEHRLRLLDFHANWNIENTVKLFSSVKQSIEEHLEYSPSIEAHFFCSYMWVSDIKGKGHSDIMKAIQSNQNALRLLSQVDNIAIQDGYKSIYLAMSCWLALKNDKPFIKKLEEVEELVEKYIDASEEKHKLFKASIHATKGFAFGRLAFARYHESQSELKLATDADPNNAEWLFMFGLMSWRISKYDRGRYSTAPNLDEVKIIMDKVLELKPDHAYAMVVNADIQRRNYEHNEHNKKNELHQYNENSSLKLNSVSSNMENELGLYQTKYSEVREIIKLLETSESNASRPKTLSLVAQCYIRMGSAFYEKDKPNNIEIHQVYKLEFLCSAQMSRNYFLAARNVIDKANKRLSVACILFQEAILYREQNEPEKQLRCLDLAIKLNPSNIATSIEKAKALTCIGRQTEALELYDTLPCNYKDYPFVYLDINYSFARYLHGQKEYDKAASKNKECVDIALTSFVNKNVSGKVEFYKDQDAKIRSAIRYYRKHLEVKRRENPQDIKPKQQLAEFHQNLMHYKDACFYFQEALGALVTSEQNYHQEIDIRVKLANATLKSGNLDKASKMLEYFTNTDKDLEDELQKEINTMETYVRIAKGENAFKLGRYQEAKNHFRKATISGNLEGANGLLKTIKMEKDDNFFLHCAFIKKCLKTAIGEDKLRLKSNLREAMLSFDKNCLLSEPLKELRECQLNMEYSYLLSPELASKEIGFVIHKARSTLNYAVRMFRDYNYPEAEAEKEWEDNCDFFIIHNATARNVEKKIVNKLKRLGWKNFRNRFGSLLAFLVSIQPVSNPGKNNWLIPFIDLDNFQKHVYSLTVYKNKDGELVDNTVKIIDVARSACIHINTILDQFLAHVN